MTHSHAFRLLTRSMIVCFSLFSAQQAVLDLRAQDPAADKNKKPALTIRVLEGENGVNIIKKKTAVKPVVEVRDENDLPVSGAFVNFFLPDFSPTASFSQGGRILSLTTDSMGRAAVREMVPIGEGKFTIRVTASSQGRSAKATIVQTNYLTASAATAAGAAVGGVAGAKAGISGALLGVIIGGAAIGAVVAVKMAGGGGGSGGSGASGGSPSTPHGTIGVGAGPTINRP